MVKRNMKVEALLLLLLFQLSNIVSGETSRQDGQSSNISIPVKNSTMIPEISCLKDILVEKEFVLLNNGTLFLPSNQQLYHNDTYNLYNNTAYICVDNEELLVNSTVEYKYSEEFMHCGHFFLEEWDFTLLENGTVVVPIYNRSYDSANYVLYDDGVYVCAPTIDKTLQNSTMNQPLKFSNAFNLISAIGMCISIVSLVLHLVAFCLVTEVRNLPGCCLASLSLSLLLAYLCFLSTSAAKDKLICADVGLAAYYFFLAAFFWMNIIAFDVWRSFRIVISKFRISSHRVPYRRFLVYSAYSWLVPAALTSVVLVADRTDFFHPDFKPAFGSAECWFSNRKALLVYFACPLIFVMLVNAFFFLDSAYVINLASMKKPQVSDSVLRRRCFMFMRLALIMGLNWIVGFVAAYVQYQVLWYLFVILNTLQGLFIFIVFSCSSKVRALVVKKLNKRPPTRQGTSVRTISQISNVL